MRGLLVDLARVARLRASGFSWVAVARETGVHESTLMRRTRANAKTWKGLLAEAEVAIARESAAEAVMLLRQELRADTGKDRRDAAAKLLRYAVQAVGRSKRSANEAGEATLSPEMMKLARFVAKLNPEQVDAFIRSSAVDDRDNASPEEAGNPSKEPSSAPRET
jgi:hypothetical protein